MINSQLLELKIVFIGNIFTGKSQFFNKIKPKIISSESSPICDIYSIVRKCKEKIVKINIVDTNGSRHFDEQRIAVINKANIILLFFDVSKPETFQDIERRWLPYLERSNIHEKIYLIGTKIDLQILVSLEKIEKLKNLYNFQLFFVNSFDTELCQNILNKIINKMVVRFAMEDQPVSSQILAVFEELQNQTNSKNKQLINKIYEELSQLTQNKINNENREENIAEYLKTIKKKLLLSQQNQSIIWQEKVEKKDQKIQELEHKFHHLEKQLIKTKVQLSKTKEQKKNQQIFKEEVKEMDEIIEKLYEENKNQKQNFKKLSVRLKETQKAFQLLNLFKESRNLREIKTEGLLHLKQIIEKFTHRMLKKLNFYFGYDKLSGNRLPSDRKQIQNILTLVKIANTIIMFFSMQKIAKNVQSALMIVYHPQNGLEKAQILEDKKFCSSGMHDLTYGDAEIKIMLNKKQVIITEKQQPFIHADRSLKRFCQLPERDKWQFEDCQLLILQFQ